MNFEVSPKYQMALADSVILKIIEEYPTEPERKFYLINWRKIYRNSINAFDIEYESIIKNVNLKNTIYALNTEVLLKIAIDLGLQTPYFIPSVPVFKNELKISHVNALATFEKASKQIEEHPDIAIGLANSALESIIKEILKDERINGKIKGSETLYGLTQEVLKAIQLLPNSDMPQEIKTIGSSLLSASQGIEKLRSEKTNAHGKTDDDEVVESSIYAYFILNSVTTIGLFLNSYYKNKFPKTEPTH
ncbi:abortive infection family protein [Crocinitomicaceae bacterium CZZ-1]|uniref:Abortive infection family protein n=1 Tax=Taishania pollutisoli TaxID=2766479 RepID=A0A8J6TXR0_9FLAO|nr:abortive infection family protein [Taishania pollutisoli]MBC9812896.1 abortive infection family protein [Taishania pollutisoli]